MWSSWKNEGQQVILPELPSPITRSDYEQIAASCLEKFLKMEQEGEAEGWKEIPFESTYGPNDIKLYDKKAEGGSDVSIIKIVATVDCPLQELFDVCNDNDYERRKLFEQDLMSSELIEQVTDNITVIRQRYAVPFPVTNREVVGFKSSARLSDGTMVIFGQSINHPQCLSNSNFIRATGISSTILRVRTKNDIGSVDPYNGKAVCLLTKIVQVDPKGSIPTWLVNQGKKKMAISIANLRRVLAEILVDEIRAKQMRRESEELKIKSAERDNSLEVRDQPKPNQPLNENSKTSTSTSTSLTTPAVNANNVNTAPIKPSRVVHDTDSEATTDTEEEVFYDLTENMPPWIKDSGINSTELKLLITKLQETVERIEGGMKGLDKKIGALEQIIKDDESNSALWHPKQEQQFAAPLSTGGPSWKLITLFISWPVVALALYEMLIARRRNHH